MRLNSTNHKHYRNNKRIMVFISLLHKRVIVTLSALGPLPASGEQFRKPRIRGREQLQTQSNPQPAIKLN